MAPLSSNQMRRIFTIGSRRGRSFREPHSARTALLHTQSLSDAEKPPFVSLQTGQPFHRELFKPKWLLYLDYGTLKGVPPARYVDAPLWHDVHQTRFLHCFPSYLLARAHENGGVEILVERVHEDLFLVSDKYVAYGVSEDVFLSWCRLNAMWESILDYVPIVGECVSYGVALSEEALKNVLKEVKSVRREGEHTHVFVPSKPFMREVCTPPSDYPLARLYPLPWVVAPLVTLKQARDTGTPTLGQMWGSERADLWALRSPLLLYRAFSYKPLLTFEEVDMTNLLYVNDCYLHLLDPSDHCLEYYAPYIPQEEDYSKRLTRDQLRQVPPLYIVSNGKTVCVAVPFDRYYGERDMASYLTPLDDVDPA